MLKKYWIVCGLLVAMLCGRLASPGNIRTSMSPDPGTREMAARLDALARTADPSLNEFMNAERAELIELRIRQAAGVQAVELQSRWAMELLNAGDTLNAISMLDHLVAFAGQNEKAVGPANFALFRLLQATAYIRQAEEDNCLTNHTTESCLFPIRGAGVHTVTRGSRAAIQVLTGELGRDPGNLKLRWLLNIACMTAGEYPAKVPPQWLIGPKCFESDYDIKRFPDIAGNLGVDVDDLAGGSISEDFDGDGFLDIMASAMSPRGQLRFFRNNGDGTFADRTEAAGLIGQTGGLNIVQTDYNNDGFADVLILRGGWMYKSGKLPNSLLRNNRDGTFSDVTSEAGLLSFHPTQTAVWFDYNGDGWLDLFIGNETLGENIHACELFRNNADGTFTECAAEMKVESFGYVKGVASADYNNDGRPDLYVSRHGQPNILYRNDGPAGADRSPAGLWKFTDVAAQAGVTEPIKSFPTWFFDFDNDGWQDLFVSGYMIHGVGDVAADYLGLPHQAERPRLYRNKGDGTFQDVTASMGLNKVLHTMGCNYGDLDHDGFLDFYAGTGDPRLDSLMPNRMFRNDAGKRFQDVTTSGGFGHLQKGHGVSFADFDQDGDQDIYSVIGGAYSGDHYRNVLFENPGHGNDWIGLKLEGVQSNRPGLGARIKVTLETAEGPRVIHQTVSTGSSFGASPFRQQIGLGPSAHFKSVQISWPTTGKAQTFTNLSVKKWWRIKEGDSTPQELPLKTFKFAKRPPGNTSHQHHH